MPALDVSFHVSGGNIPADHSYFLLSAVSSLIPDVHSNGELGIFPINGSLSGNRQLLLTERSRLVFRISHEDLPLLLPLSGKKLNIGGHSICIDVPETRLLNPSPLLKSRLVIIKGFMDPEPFLEAAIRQLSDLGIKGKPTLIARKSFSRADDALSSSGSPYVRRTIRIKDKEVVGYSMIVDELNDEESILLQAKGIGGRRHMGCGLFVPFKGK